MLLISVSGTFASVPSVIVDNVLTSRLSLYLHTTMPSLLASLILSPIARDWLLSFCNKMRMLLYGTDEICLLSSAVKFQIVDWSQHFQILKITVSKLSHLLD